MFLCYFCLQKLTMRRIIAIIITLCLLFAGAPLESAAKEKKKKKHKKSWIYRFLHKKHDRLQKYNTGHTEFKNRPKREQKRISKHHLDPNKPIKQSKKDKQKMQQSKQKDAQGGGEEGQKAEEAPKEEPKPAEEPK